ncbi:MAG: FKBP-type peptidyl-prolyl cis-trans isomerase [Vicinamibacterales bacterium]
MSRFCFAVLVCCLAMALSGCGSDSSPTSPSAVPDFSRTDLRVGTGAAAVSGSTLTVNYTGWLYDESKTDSKGPLFETSLGRSTFTFILGNSQVIAGWEQGVPGMQVGGLRRLVLPPSLAYGNVRSGPIPANASLVFEIELLDVQ